MYMVVKVAKDYYCCNQTIILLTLFKVSNSGQINI